MIVPFTRLHPDAIPFAYIHEDDACMDMYALHDMDIEPGKTTIVPTGVALQIPKGFEGIVRGRSGLASKGIITHMGTVDSNYRGDVGVVLYNTTDKVFHIGKHMRIAQFTIKTVIPVILMFSPKLSETNRGTNGYGSSGYYKNDETERETTTEQA